MSGHEGIPVETKTSPEIKHQYEHIQSDLPHLKYLLAMSGSWTNRPADRAPTKFRSTMSYGWNVPFYRGFYPDLPEGDILGYRTLATIDGNAIVHLSDISHQLKPGHPGRYLDFDLDSLQPLVDGGSMSDIRLLDIDRINKSSAAQKRLEQGMPRGMRVFAAMIPLDHLSRSEDAEDIDMQAHKNKLFDILDLNEEERGLTQGILQRIHDQRKLN